MTDIERKREQVFLESNKALVRHMDDRTIAIVGFKDGEPNGIGSGTCITIGDRYLVATAAHVIEGYSPKDMALVHSRVPSQERYTFERSGIRDGSSSARMDIAWLELKPETAKALGKNFVTLDRILTADPHLETDLVLLSGFPGQLIKQELLAKKRLAVQAMGYYTQTLPQPLWPDWADASRDIYLDYPNVGNVTYQGTTIKIPEPYGVSGGGIWAARINNGGVWTPDMSKLIGIECAWSEGSRWARGIQIKHWLKMVSEDFLDLTPRIAPLLSKSP